MSECRSNPAFAVCLVLLYIFLTKSSPAKASYVWAPPGFRYFSLLILFHK